MTSTSLWWEVRTFMIWNYRTSFWSISTFIWCWKMVAKWKWSNFSKKGHCFWIICIESNLIFCRKKYWKSLNIFDWVPTKYYINWKVWSSAKCSFLSFEFGPCHPNIPSHPVLRYLFVFTIQSLGMKTIWKTILKTILLFVCF